MNLLNEDYSNDNLTTDKTPHVETRIWTSLEKHCVVCRLNIRVIIAEVNKQSISIEVILTVMLPALTSFQNTYPSVAASVITSTLCKVKRLVVYCNYCK